MPIYTFKRNDNNELIEQNHSIHNIPNHITCDDGIIANRVFNVGNVGVVYKGHGDSWPSKQERIKNQMTRKNESAGKRGEKDWRARNPKLVMR